MRRSYKVRILLLVMLLFLVLPGQPVNAKSATEYDKVIEQMKQLEQCAKDYHSENSGDTTSEKNLVAVYLLCDRYKDEMWQQLSVRKNEDFEAYVEKNNAQLLELKTIDKLMVPADYEVDFLHLVGTLFVSDDAGGWVGDLTQFIAEVKSEQIVDENAVKQKFASDGSSFNEADIMSDVDGSNMGTLYKNLSLSEALEQYYGPQNSRQTNIHTFLEQHFTDLDNLEKFTQSVSYAYRSQWMTETVTEALDINLTEDADYMNKSINAFSVYFFERESAYMNSEEGKIYIQDKAKQEEIKQIETGTEDSFITAVKNAKAQKEDLEEDTESIRKLEEATSREVKKMRIATFLILTILVIFAYSIKRTKRGRKK